MLRPLVLVAISAWSAQALAQAATDSTPTASPSPASSSSSPVATETVRITGRTLPATASVAGFGPQPPSQTPLQTLSVSGEQLKDTGVGSEGDFSRLNASISDSYNAAGYVPSYSVRGYTLDNQYNYRRDGLPITGETAVNLDNKARVEVLEGISGIQSGTSAPGGLINFVVKRPQGIVDREFFAGYTSKGGWKAAADLDQPLDANGMAAVRINASWERLDPQLRDAEGHRHLLATAGTLHISPQSTLDADIEYSHQAQPSQPGFSLLGGTLPKASSIDPRINLNNQSWSGPVVFDGTTTSLRYTQHFQTDLTWTVHGQYQRLRTDDRAAFPFGCSSEDNWSSYCSDGTMDLWDFRSLHEHRTTHAIATRLEGSDTWLSMNHRWSVDVLWSDYRARLGDQVYNDAGVGNISGGLQVPAATEPTTTNTNRTERNLEFSLRDVIQLTVQNKLWLGVRHTRLHRDSALTDGSEATSYAQTFTTPWVALTRQWTPEWMTYVSWGQGIESSVVPNQPIYTNAGQALQALKSRQTEIGTKYAQAHWVGSLTLFDIQRPETSDQGACDASASCTQVIDGNERHTGLEAALQGHWGAWSGSTSWLWMRARREDAQNSDLNGQIPVNVPRQSLRATLGYAVAAVPGLNLQGSVMHEGSRMVLPDNSVAIPGWTTWALTARYGWRNTQRDYVLRVGIENLFDQRAWRESPYQYAHAYLFPLEPRTLQISLQAHL